MNPRSISEIASKYGTTTNLTRLILSRAEFNKFCLGSCTRRCNGRYKSCLCYNDCAKFSQLFKQQVSLRSRLKHKLVV